MSGYYICPLVNDGTIPITFNKILMVYNVDSGELLPPSCPSPKSYKHLELVQKNLAWSGADIIRAWNKEDGSDAVIYVGRWGLDEKELHH